MKIADCIRPEHVAIDVEAGSKRELLQILSDRAGELLGINDKEISTQIRNREKLGSTGIGAGIAIPHAPVAGIAAPFGFLARLEKPIDFDAVDEQPVDIVCLMLTPPEKGGACLSLLSRIARQLRSPEILKRIRSATSTEQLYSAITEADD